MKSDRMFASFWELVGSSRMGRNDDVDFTVIVFLVSIMVPDKWGESDLAHMSILFAHVFHFDAYLLSSEV